MQISIKEFPGQHPNEKIVLVLRRHWLVLFKHVLFTLIFASLPAIVYALLKRGVPEITTSEFFPIIALLISGFYLFILIYFFLGWIDYYLDVWIVTTDRIINIEQNGLFRRVVAEQNIFRVQDVTAEVHGLIHTFFDFGNVLVQTAGTKDRFSFEQVPHPYKVKKIIIHLNERKIAEEPYYSAARAEDGGPQE